ncbi:MAG: LppX_LprAFG lipoprotein [Mycobacterium sp.]
MQKRRRLFGVLAALTTTAVLVVGCSSADSGSEIPSDLPDAATLLSDSAATTRAQQSVHLLLTVDGVISGLPIKTLEGDLTNTPEVAAEGNVEIALTDPPSQANFVVLNELLYTDLIGGWAEFGPAAEIYDVGVILNPDRGLANILSSFTDPKVDGVGTINGVQSARIIGKVSPDAVNAIAAKIGATEPVDGTAWVAVDGDHAMTQARLTVSAGNSITMATSDWGKPVDVVAPV